MLRRRLCLDPLREERRTGEPGGGRDPGPGRRGPRGCRWLHQPSKRAVKGRHHPGKPAPGGGFGSCVAAADAPKLPGPCSTGAATAASRASRDTASHSRAAVSAARASRPPSCSRVSGRGGTMPWRCAVASPSAISAATVSACSSGNGPFRSRAASISPGRCSITRIHLALVITDVMQHADVGVVGVKRSCESV